MMANAVSLASVSAMIVPMTVIRLTAMMVENPMFSARITISS